MSKKEDLIKKYQTHKSDTGSSAVQIVLLTQQIKDLTSHLRKHQKDHDSKKGLLKMVNKRRKLLSYLEKSDPKTYKKILSDLKLKPSRRSSPRGKASSLAKTKKKS